MRLPSRNSTTLFQHDCFVHACDATSLHILLRRVAVVVGAWCLKGCADVVIAHTASTRVTILVVQKNTIQGFLRAARRSVSKVHVGLCSVQLLLHLPPSFLPSIVDSVASIAVSSISSTSSASLLLLHRHHVHHGMLDGGCIHYLRYMLFVLYNCVCSAVI